MNLQAILDGLAVALRTIPELRVFSYSPDVIAPPAAVVQLPSSITYGITFGGALDTYTIPVLVLVGSASDRAAQSNLASYMSTTGPNSIKGAVAGDSTLGGIVDIATITRCTGAASYTIGGTDYLGARFDAEVT